MPTQITISPQGDDIVLNGVQNGTEVSFYADSDSAGSALDKFNKIEACFIFGEGQTKHVPLTFTANTSQTIDVKDIAPPLFTKVGIFVSLEDDITTDDDLYEQLTTNTLVFTFDGKTLADYGITDAYTKTEVNNLLGDKEDKSNKVEWIGDVNKESTTMYPSIAAVTRYVDVRFPRLFVTNGNWTNYDEEKNILAPDYMEDIKVNDFVYNSKCKMMYICIYKNGGHGNTTLTLVPFALYISKKEVTQNKASSIDSNNRASTTMYPAVKAIVDYIDAAVGSVSTLSFEVAQTKPTQNIKTNVIYLIPAASSATGNVYEEWIYINNAWELIGSTQIDLSNYYTKSQVDNLIPTVPTNVSAFTNDAGYLTQHQNISGKEDKSNKVTYVSEDSTDAEYPSALCLYNNMPLYFKGSIKNGLISFPTTGQSVYFYFDRCELVFMGLDDDAYKLYLECVIPNTAVYAHFYKSSGVIERYKFEGTKNDDLIFVHV